MILKYCLFCSDLFLFWTHCFLKTGFKKGGQYGGSVVQASDLPSPGWSVQVLPVTV